jgi:hypothetical protein
MASITRREYLKNWKYLVIHLNLRRIDFFDLFFSFTFNCLSD